MKCPGCSFVCSDLRDICPRCYVDFRPTKIGLGIKITNPSASYKTLVAELRPGGAPSVEGAATSTSLFGTIKKVFARAEPMLVEGAPKEEQPDSASVTTNTNIQTVISEELLAAALEDPDLQVVVETDDDTTIQSELLAAEEEDIEWTEAGPNSAILDDLDAVLSGVDSDDAASAHPAALLGPPSDTSTIAAEATHSLADEIERCEMPPCSAVVALPPVGETVEEGEASLLLTPVRPVTAENLLIRDLFCDATVWFDRNYDDDSVELSLEQFSSFRGREDIVLFFDLAAEVIDDPGRVFETKIIESSERKVLAPSLVQALERTEKIYAQSVLSLRQGLPRVADADRGGAETVRPAGPRSPPASLRRRMGALAIDSLVILLLSIGAGMLIAWRIDKDMQFDLLSLSALSFADLVLISGWSIATFLLVFPIFPVLCDLMFERTPGQLVQGLVVRQWDGRKAGPLLVARRGLLQGIVMLCGLAIPWSKTAKTSMLDVLSATVVSLRS